MFVISIKRIFDCSGNRLEKPEYEYFSYDKYASSFNTGYPTWMGLYHAETFKTSEQAKKVYMENLHILYCCWKDYDRDSIRICEITSVKKIDKNTFTCEVCKRKYQWASPCTPDDCEDRFKDFCKEREE